MKLLSYYMKWVLSALLVISPLTTKFAFAGEPVEVNANSAPETSPNGNIVIPVVNKESGSTTNIVIPRSTKEELEANSPEAIRKGVAAEQEIAKQKKQSVFSTTVKRFVPESTAFFIAVGAVMYTHVAFDYASNPLAMEQHFQSLADPVSHLAFFNFMLANHAVAEPLMAMKQFPKLRKFVPYIGMSAGMVASSLTHDLVVDKDLHACAKSLLNRKAVAADKNMDPCQKSYYNWVTGPMPKVHNYITGIMSLVASTFLSGVATGVAVHSLRFISLQLVTFVTPGGIWIKGGQFVLKVASLAGFTAIDMWLAPKIMGPFKNWRQGKDLRETEQSLLSKLHDMKMRGWVDPACNQSKDFCRHTFMGELKYFNEAIKAWREFNMETVMMSYITWMEHLTKLTGMYRYTFNFYGHYLNELQTKFKSPSNPTASLVDRRFHLYGVTPKGLPQDRQEMFLEWPDKIEELQQETLKDSAALLAKEITDPQNAKHLNKYDKENATKWMNQLRSTNVEENGKAISDIKNCAERGNMMGSTHSPVLVDIARDVYKSMGKASPKPGIGEGYLATYAASPFAQQAAEFTKHKGSLSHQVLVGMLCGPDAEKGEKLISSWAGFSSTFKPPQLKLASDEVRMVCQNSSILNYPDAFNRNLFVAKNDNSHKLNTYNGPMDYLRQNTRASAYGKTGEPGFVNWWSTNVEPQMIEAIRSFGEKYNEVVLRLYDKMTMAEDSNFNRGPMANGGITSLLQEQRLYTMILGEMFKDLFVKQHKKDLPAQLFAKRPMIYKYNVVDDVESFPAIGMLRYNTNLDLANMAQAYPNSPLAAKFKGPTGRTLQFQEVVVELFAELTKELAKLEVRESGDRVILAKNVDLKAMETKMQDLQQAVQVIAMTFGMSEDQSYAMVTLNDGQKALVTTLLQGILGVASELMQLAQIAQAVNYSPDKAPTNNESAKPCVRGSGINRVYGGAPGC